MRISPACRASAEMHVIGQIHAVFRTIEGIGSQVGALRPSTWKPGEGTQGCRNILSGETRDLDTKSESNAISCVDIQFSVKMNTIYGIGSSAKVRASGIAR